MPAWILDDGPFGDLARFVEVEDLPDWPQGQLFVAEQTALDATKSPARQAVLDAALTPFQSFRVMMGTDAFDILYNHL